MATVLTIGGARFIGRFTVREFLERGDDVTLFTRGKTPIPFDDSAVDHVRGDRRNDGDLRDAREAVDPDVVVDFAALYPEDVRAATEIFADVDAYVYVSSTSAYDQAATLRVREGETPLHPCTAEQATDDSGATYGARKAEGDRVLFDAADRGVNAFSVRPTAIYGPYDPTARQNYWIERVREYDRIVVPGEVGWTPVPLGYVEDVARAIRTVVDRGDPGEAYNVASRTTPSIDDLIGYVAGALDTSVTVVHAAKRDLAAVGLSPSDFSLCRSDPYVVSTEKLASLGWDSTPFDAGFESAVSDHLERGPDGSQHGPDRGTEERLLTMGGDARHVDGS